MYNDETSLLKKIETVAKKIYRAEKIILPENVTKQLLEWENNGFKHLPICFAKTQYSFTTNPNLRGAPNGHEIPVREVRLSAGAGFIVVICGQIMTMPGLPKNPSAEKIELDLDGQIQGLF